MLLEFCFGPDPEFVLDQMHKKKLLVYFLLLLSKSNCCVMTQSAQGLDLVDRLVSEFSKREDGEKVSG